MALPRTRTYYAVRSGSSSGIALWQQLLPPITTLSKLLFGISVSRGQWTSLNLFCIWFGQSSHSWACCKRCKDGDSGIPSNVHEWQFAPAKGALSSSIWSSFLFLRNHCANFWYCIGAKVILEALYNCFSKFSPKLSESHVAANIQLSGHIPLFCSEALKIDLKPCGTLAPAHNSCASRLRSL